MNEIDPHAKLSSKVYIFTNRVTLAVNCHFQTMPV